MQNCFGGAERTDISSLRTTRRTSRRCTDGSITGEFYLFYDQRLPDDDPEGLARAVDEAVSQYGSDALRNELVDLGEWYRWLHN